MYKINEDAESLEISISSEFHLVDRAISDTIAFLDNFCPDASKSDIKLLLREILNNAVEHGNKKDKKKSIDLSCQKIEDNYFRFTVQDEGKGYDTDKIDYEMTGSPEEERSRGLPLISSLSEKIQFNDTGNEIIVHYRFPVKKMARIIEKESDQDDITIIPEENITSSTSSVFKEQLLKILEKKPSKVNLDFNKVKEFDSIGLSLIAIFGKKLKEENPDAIISIKNAKIEIIQLFLHTGLDRFFELF